MIEQLASEGIKLNVTAILTQTQIKIAISSVSSKTPAILSVFAGRIADTGIDPAPWISNLTLSKKASSQILWASVREPLNIYQAERCGADIITVPVPILRKAISMRYMDLDALCRDTVGMFIKDAQASGFAL